MKDEGLMKNRANGTKSVARHSQQRKVTTAAVISALSALTLGGGANVMAADGPQVLEEVVVTATRRLESVQDIPTSIVALTGDDLANRGITDLRDLSEAVSGLTLNRADNALGAAVYIRGMGTEGTTAAKKSVGVIYDNMYLIRPGLIFSEMLDVASVEVLRGPQGTNFGKNTTAGVIRITTADPNPNEFSGKIQGVAGNLGAAEVRGVVNVPIIDDTLGLRVSGFTAERDGYTENTTLGIDTRNVDREGYRAKLLWNLTDSFQLRLSAEHTEDRGDADSTNTANAFYVAPEIGVYANNLGAWDDETDRYTVNLRWLVADHALTVFWGQEKSDSLIIQDYDQTPVPILSLSNLGELDTESLEVQWTSSFDGPFNYLIGYFKQEQDSTSTTEIPGVYTGVSTILEDSEAVFANLRYQFTPQFGLQAGVRYSDDASVGMNIHHDGEKTFDELTYSFKLTYAVDDNSMVYASYDKGYKQGGINRELSTCGRIPGVPFPGGCLQESQAFWQPELSYNHELGFKTELFDKTLRLNTAVFYAEYEDYQSTFSIPGLAQVLISNASKVESFGAEADFLWAASDLLTINGSVTYVDTEYDSFTGSPCGWSAQPGCVAGQIDLSGQTLNRAPELSFNVGAEMRSGFSLISGTEWFARVDAVYVGDQNLSTTLEEFAEESAYTLVNARAGLEMENGLKVTLWGRNVFDEEYRINAGIGDSPIRRGLVQSELPGLEATYGVTVDYAF